MTPTGARAAIVAALEAAVPDLYVADHYRHLDYGSGPAALVDWTQWQEPVTGCPDGPVTCQVTLVIAGSSDPDAQSKDLDALVELAGPGLDRLPCRRGIIEVDSDEILGRFVRVPVTVT